MTKIVFSLADGLRVESVLDSHAPEINAVHVEPGRLPHGLRLLPHGVIGPASQSSAEEIVGQVYAVRHGLGRAIDNIVFMGMGEPLDNFDNVAQAIRVLSDQRGLDIPHSHMTISTAGLTDGIRRLGELGWPGLNLAVSLNAADDELRSQLMLSTPPPPCAAQAGAAKLPAAKKRGFLY